MVDDEKPRTEAEDLLNAGMALGGPKVVPFPTENILPYAVIPAGARIETLEQCLPTPLRIRATPTFLWASSFVAYLSRFKTPGTVVYADSVSLRIVAVIDHHEPTHPGWGAHRATLALRCSEVWTQWAKANGTKMDQVTFAAFLEDHLPDIVSPPGAEVFEIARSLEIKKAVSFASAVRLQDGQTQFHYIEDIQNHGPKGVLSVPDRVSLGLEPFDGAGIYRVDARLRHRLHEGTLTMWYELHRPEAVLRQAFLDTIKTIAADGGGTMVLWGTP